MNRREFLSQASGTVVLVGLAGCSGNDSRTPTTDTRTRYVSTVPLAYYNTYLRRDEWMVRYDLENLSSEPIDLRLTTDYRDYSEPTIARVTVPPGETATVDQIMVLRREAVASVTTTTEVSLSAKIEWRAGDG